MKQIMMDKCIRANVRLAENEIAITITMTLAFGLCFLNMWLAVFSVIPAVVSTVYLFKTYKKIFYDSVYGQAATTYQSLPAATEEMTAAKIFAAGLTNLLANILLLAMVLCMFNGYSWLGMGDIIEAIRKVLSLSSAGISYLLPLEFLNIVVSSFWQATLIFMVIVIYKSVKIKGRKIPAWLAIIGGFALNYAISEIPSLLTLLDIEYGPAHTILNIAVSLVTMVIMFRITVKLLEEKYEV